MVRLVLVLRLIGWKTGTSFLSQSLSVAIAITESLSTVIWKLLYKEVERVRTYKLLGVIISDDLKWSKHVEFVIAKAAKRLFALRLLKRAGVMPKDILKVYLSNVRSVLEYAAQVWLDIPAYLSDAIESIQRRALRIIFPNSSYQQVLELTNLSTLANRRIDGWYDRWEPPHILSHSQSHNTRYAISIKIRKDYSSKNYEKDKGSKWLFYI